jgi:hypothetical protein
MKAYSMVTVGGRYSMNGSDAIMFSGHNVIIPISQGVKIRQFYVNEFILRMPMMIGVG